MQALADSHAYEESLLSLYSRRDALADIYDTLLCEDAARAADLLKSTYERTGSREGYVSIEVSPTVANDTNENGAARPDTHLPCPTTQCHDQNTGYSGRDRGHSSSSARGDQR